MLVLTRRFGERLLLTTPDGCEIEVHILERDGNKNVVKVGIEAPREVKVLRAELTEDAS